MAYAAPVDSRNIAVQKLEKRGFTRTQAEGIVEIVSDAAGGDAVTKYDLSQLEVRLYKYLGGILIAHAVSHSWSDGRAASDVGLKTLNTWRIL
jgi:hypothetical protein